MRRTNRRRGVTLIEMLAVLVIIGLVATVAVINVMDRLERGKVDFAKGQIDTLKQAVNLFKMDHGKYPDSLQDLVTAPGWIKKPFPEGGYLQQSSVPLDPWGNPFSYVQDSASRFTITCYGRDGQPGGAGYDADITNHDSEGQK